MYINYMKSIADRKIVTWFQFFKYAPTAVYFHWEVKRLMFVQETDKVYIGN